MPILYHQYVCLVCSKKFPTFRLLDKHFRAEHPNPVKRYSLNNKRFKQRALVYATSIKNACQGLGWLEIDCVIKVLK